MLLRLQPFLSDTWLESLMVNTTIEISEAGPHDGERRAVPVEGKVIVMEADMQGEPVAGKFYPVVEQEYVFAGRVAADGTPIYVRGKRRPANA